MLAEIVSAVISGNIIYSDAINPDTYSINTGLAVGSTPGTLTATGSAGYQIPIETPSGTNGLQPAISLNYMSNYVNGILGIGWSIGGLSAISRVNKNVYNDGMFDPIRGNLTDKYALDGNRLLVISA